MGKAHRGRRIGEGETAIQREALQDFLSPSHQAGPARQSRRDIESESGSSLVDQTPSYEDFRGSSQGVGDKTWVGEFEIIHNAMPPSDRLWSRDVPADNPR